MGKATILASLGDGYYRIKLHFDNTRVDARKTYIDTKVAEYATQLIELEPSKVAKTAALNAALLALNTYINSTDPKIYTESPTELNRLTAEGYKARGELDVILHEEKIIRLRKTELEQEKKYLDKFCPADFETHAWCVELNESLSGEMDVIECDYVLMRDPVDDMIEHDTGIWLPASASIPSTSLIHPLASSAHATWFNLAMAPAAQRHKARYRIATIHNLNKSTDTCDLSFDGQYSVDRPSGRLIDDFPIYPQIGDVQHKDYAGANIVYGTCNAKAFKDLDRVIVDLHGGDGVPTVIGFYENPRQCSGPFAVAFTGGGFDVTNTIYKTAEIIGYERSPLCDYDPENGYQRWDWQCTDTIATIGTADETIVHPVGGIVSVVTDLNYDLFLGWFPDRALEITRKITTTVSINGYTEIFTTVYSQSFSAEAFIFNAITLESASVNAAGDTIFRFTRVTYERHGGPGATTQSTTRELITYSSVGDRTHTITSTVYDSINVHYGALPTTGVSSFETCEYEGNPPYHVDHIPGTIVTTDVYSLGAMYGHTYIPG